MAIYTPYNYIMPIISSYACTAAYMYSYTMYNNQLLQLIASF